MAKGFYNRAIVHVGTKSAFHGVNVSLQGVAGNLDSMRQTKGQILHEHVSHITGAVANGESWNQLRFGIQGNPCPRVTNAALSAIAKRGLLFHSDIARREGLGSEIPETLWDAINNPMVFKPLAGDPGHGYEATHLIDVCSAIVDAHRDGKLRPNQAFLGLQAEIIIRASAKLGIVALIDEATGYIADKRKEEYRDLFREFIRDEFREYKAEFPNQFFDMIYRLYRLPRGSNKNNHPQFFGHFIRRYIYEPLASSHGAILELLDERNPVVYVNGGRRYKMFQFLSDVVGLPALRAHLWQVVGIGNSVKNKDAFERSFLNAFPTLEREPLLPLFDD